MGKFTIKDIARLANVSNATVSRVINNYPYINEKTKKKVLKVISKTDYQPVGFTGIGQTKSHPIWKP